MKYNNIVNLLKAAKPHLDSSEEIEREVLRRISEKPSISIMIREAVDFIFRWVYIPWIRRSLIAASFALVVICVYQQMIILNSLDYLSKQTILVDRGKFSSHHSFLVEKLLTNYKSTGFKLQSGSITVSEKQMQELIESVNELQGKYKDLENLIESDPELKKMIEKKIIENSLQKSNL